VPEHPAFKVISTDAVPKAVEKAEHYRLLNDPEQAESICLDVLAVEPHHQVALRVLVLAMTDQFGTPRGAADVKRARAFVTRLTDEYERAYYTGLICERQGRAYLARTAGSLAYGPFREAMEWYEKAERIRPSGNDDAILRWNTCARILARNPALAPSPAEAYEPSFD
jgi:tetratricopeptide (TPR) repeat protein